MKIKNPITKTIHILSWWAQPTYRILKGGKKRRSFLKHYSFKAVK